MDKCIFVKENVICVVYVDDTILTSPDAKALEQMIASLGIGDEEQRYMFELQDESEVGDFIRNTD